MSHYEIHSCHIMKLVLATKEDSERLATFYKEINWLSSFELKRERHQSFFYKYELQSDDFITYMLIDEKNRIQATASIVFRKAWVEGIEQTVGYASDLKVSLKRPVILKWPHIFFPLLEEEKKKRNCKYIFSILLKNQREAYNALIRPRSPRRQLPRYYLFRRFHITTIHGIFPFAHKPLKTIITRKAKKEDAEELADYIIKKTTASPLYYLNSKDDFFSNLNRWHNLDIEDFTLAINNKKIVGCVAPWSNKNLNQIHVVKEKPFGITLRNSLNFLSYFGLSHKLYHKKNKEITFQYMTHFYADNPDIFYSLLMVSYQSLAKNEFLVYSHFEEDILKKIPSQFISGAIQCGFYCILKPDDPFPGFLKYKVLQEAPDFELAFM